MYFSKCLSFGFRKEKAVRWFCLSPVGKAAAGGEQAGSLTLWRAVWRWPWAQDLHPGVGQGLGLSASRPGPPPSAELRREPGRAGSARAPDLQWGGGPGGSLCHALTSCHGAGGLTALYRALPHAAALAASDGQWPVRPQKAPS